MVKNAANNKLREESKVESCHISVAFYQTRRDCWQLQVSVVVVTSQIQLYFFVERKIIISLVRKLEIRTQA